MSASASAPRGAAKSQLLTLEQVYQMPSEWRAYVPQGSRRPSLRPLLLTALAQNACDQEGIDPHDLMYREIWQFAEPNVSEEIQLMRHAAYMQLREDKMDCVLRARDAIISARSDREALSKAVEAKIKANISVGKDGDKMGAITTWSKDGSGGGGGGSVDSEAPGSPTKAAMPPKPPVPFTSTEGFAALYSPAPDGTEGALVTVRSCVPFGRLCVAA
jgi:hypothetical protein